MRYTPCNLIHIYKGLKMTEDGTETYKWKKVRLRDL